MILVGGAAPALGALALWTVVPLVGSNIADGVLSAAPAAAIALEAGGFLLALRYGYFGWPPRGASNGFPGTAPRASELLVPLIKAAWPILVLAPACLAFALLGSIANLHPKPPDPRPAAPPAVQTPVQPAPANQAPLNQAPLNQAPLDQAPPKQAPAQQAPPSKK